MNTLLPPASSPPLTDENAEHALANLTPPGSDDTLVFITRAIAICRALQRWHAEGLIHGDLSPDTILFTEAGACRLDKSDPAPQRTHGGSNVIIEPFTPAYMSPEQTGRTKRVVDARSDLYSLGVVFYQRLTGRLPFELPGGSLDEWVHHHIACEPKAPGDIQPAIPEMLSLIVIKLLAKAPENRYQTVKALERDLDRCRSMLASSGAITLFTPGLKDVNALILATGGVLPGPKNVVTLRREFTSLGRRGTHSLVVINGQETGGNAPLISHVLGALKPEPLFLALCNIDKSRQVLPYGALSDAFHNVILYVLGQEDAQLEQLRSRLARSLGVYAELALHLAPELALILDVKTPPYAISGVATEGRFHRMLLGMVEAFATVGQPLALIINNIQWIDPASLRALEYLMAHTASLPFLLVAAQQEPADGLTLTALRQNSLRVVDITSPSIASSCPAVAPPELHSHTQIGENQDLQCVISASRALSEEIDLGRLIHILMKMTLEHGGAQRGLLIRINEGVPTIEARADITTTGVDVRIVNAAPTAADLPLSVLNAVIRTGREIRLRGSGDFDPFSRDPYLTAINAAALCVPMYKQARLVGVLYLENRLMPEAFIAEHSRIITLLVAQAAISIETATLYAELLEENIQRKRVEHELRSSQTSLILGEKISHTGSWRWETSQNTLDISAEFARIFGLENGRRTLCFSEFVTFIHGDDRPKVLKQMEYCLHSRLPLQAEYRIINKDGALRHIAGIGEPILSQGDALEYFGTITDITARKQAEDAMRAAQADLARVTRATTVGQLTASIAHEINQPLMSIVSNAGASLRWLNRSPARLDNARAGLVDIIAEGRRAGDMISSLQALTRNAPPMLNAVDLHHTAHHILTLSHSELERRKIDIDDKLEAGAFIVYGDSVQIQQVLLNLVMNAAEAMADVGDRPRILTLSSSNPTPDTLCFAIDDTGIGFSDEIKKHMFDSFYTTKERGMGMGLAISYSIIENHRGTFSAIQRHPHGSRFCFTLPTLPEGS